MKLDLQIQALGQQLKKVMTPEAFAIWSENANRVKGIDPKEWSEVEKLELPKKIFRDDPKNQVIA